MGPDLRTFYRLVEHEDLTDDDFRSDAERGLPAAVWEEPHHRAGMSTWDSLKQARDLGRYLMKRRKLAALYLVAIEVEEGSPLRVERSGPSPGHYTLYGRPAEIRARTRVVRPV